MTLVICFGGGGDFLDEIRDEGPEILHGMKYAASSEGQNIRNNLCVRLTLS